MALEEATNFEAISPVCFEVWRGSFKTSQQYFRQRWHLGTRQTERATKMATMKQGECAHPVPLSPRLTCQEASFNARSR